MRIESQREVNNERRRRGRPGLPGKIRGGDSMILLIRKEHLRFDKTDSSRDWSDGTTPLAAVTLPASLSLLLSPSLSPSLPPSLSPSLSSRCHRPSHPNRNPRRQPSQPRHPASFEWRRQSRNRSHLLLHPQWTIAWRELRASLPLPWQRISLRVGKVSQLGQHSSVVWYRFWSSKEPKPRATAQRSDLGLPIRR